MTRRPSSWPRRLALVPPEGRQLVKLDDDGSVTATEEAPPEVVRRHLAELAELVQHVRKPWRWIDPRTVEQKQDAYRRIDAVIRRARRELAEEWAAHADPSSLD